MKDHSTSQKGCGCSASFPGGHQVDGLPPAPSGSKKLLQRAMTRRASLASLEKLSS